MNRPIRILLVDDDDVFCELVYEAIDLEEELRESVHLTRLRDASLARELLLGGDAMEPEDWPDLLLLDERMPLMDGTEFLKVLREAPATRPLLVCMLSSSDQADFVRTAYSLGANFCITKPVEFAKLKSKLRDIARFFSSVIELPILDPGIRERFGRGGS